MSDILSGNVRRALELLAGAGVAALLTICAIVYAGRVMSPAQYADFYASLAVIFLVALALSPILPTVARLVARHMANNDESSTRALRRALLRITVRVGVIAGVIGAVLVVPLARWLRFQSPAPLAFSIVTALLSMTLSIDRGVLQGLFRLRQYNINMVLEAGVRAALVLALARAYPTAAFAMSAWLAGALAAQALTAVVLARGADADVSAQSDWTEFFRLLRPMAVLAVSLAIFQNVDVIAVKRWLSVEDAGAYAAASALTRGFGILFVPLYSLAGPLLTNVHERGRSVFATTLRLSAAYAGLSILPLIAVALWSKPIVGLLYGDRYDAAAFVLAPLCVVTTVTFVALMLCQGLITVGEHRFMYAWALGGAVQMAGLVLVHHSLRQVVAVLFVAQGLTAVLVTIAFLKSQKTTRAGSIISSA